MFVHLVSNASMEIFDNSLNDFTTILKSPLSLANGPWEVALFEASLPNNAQYLLTDEAYYDMYTKGTAEKVSLYEGTLDDVFEFKIPVCTIQFVNNRYQVLLPTGYSLHIESGFSELGLASYIIGVSNRTFFGEKRDSCPSLKDVTIAVYAEKFFVKRITFSPENISSVWQIGARIADASKGFVSLQYDANYDTYTCALKPPVEAIYFSETLANIFGFRDKSIQSAATKAEHAPDLHSGSNVYFLLTNIIEESHLGDTKSPVLRVLPIKTEVRRGAPMNYNCMPPQYKKISQDEINQIRIVIRNELGQLVPFSDRGRVTLTLHFRQV
jgi:hypothetical protein